MLYAPFRQNIAHWCVQRTLPEVDVLGQKATVVLGFMNKFYVWENRLLPRSFPVKLFGFLIQRAYKKDADLIQRPSPS